MVKVAALIKAIERLAWKHGTHEKVRHEIDPDGTHRIIVMVTANLAECEPPHPLVGSTTFREHPGLTWEQIKPPPRSTSKPKK